MRKKHNESSIRNARWSARELHSKERPGDRNNSNDKKRIGSGRESVLQLLRILRRSHRGRQ